MIQCHEYFSNGLVQPPIRLRLNGELFFSLLFLERFVCFNWFSSKHPRESFMKFKFLNDEILILHHLHRSFIENTPFHCQAFSQGKWLRPQRKRKKFHHPFHLLRVWFLWRMAADLNQVEGLYQSWCSKGKPSSKQDCRFNITIQVWGSVGRRWVGNLWLGRFDGKMMSLGTSKMISTCMVILKIIMVRSWVVNISLPLCIFESMIFLSPGLGYVWIC